MTETAPRHADHSPVRSAALHPAQGRLARLPSASGPPVPAQQGPFLIDFSASDTWRTRAGQSMLVDKIHEAGGVQLVVQPLSTLFTVFFIWGPVAQPMGSFLADQ